MSFCRSNSKTSNLGAYLGVLLNEMMDADPPANAPSSYLFRQACGVLLKDAEGRGYDGREQGECMEFFEKLLQHLEWEEMQDRVESFEVPSLVREIFGMTAVTKVCIYSRCVKGKRLL